MGRVISKPTSTHRGSGPGFPTAGFLTCSVCAEANGSHREGCSKVIKPNPRARPVIDVNASQLLCEAEILLIEHEWNGGDVGGSPICPECTAPKYPGPGDTPPKHKPGCRWGDFVAAARARARLGAGDACVSANAVTPRLHWVS